MEQSLYKNDGKEEDTLSTTFNKEICNNFKSTCKANGFFLKHVISAFMEKFANEDFVLEFVTVEDK
jgi:hypothetical protein